MVSHDVEVIDEVLIILLLVLYEPMIIIILTVKHSSLIFHLHLCMHAFLHLDTLRDRCHLSHLLHRILLLKLRLIELANMRFQIRIRHLYLLTLYNLFESTLIIPSIRLLQFLILKLRENRRRSTIHLI